MRIKEMVIISLLFTPVVLNKLLYMLGIIFLILILIVLFGLEVPQLVKEEQGMKKVPRQKEKRGK